MRFAPREKSLRKSWMKLRVFLGLPILTLLPACSTTITKNVVIEPPKALLAPCVAPDRELEVLEYLKAGNIREAARAHADYVLNVRDSFEICNSRFTAISEFYKGLREDE